MHELECCLIKNVFLCEKPSQSLICKWAYSNINQFDIFFIAEIRVLGEVTQMDPSSYYPHYVAMIQPSKNLPYSQDTCNNITLAHGQAPEKKRTIQMTTVKLCTCGTTSNRNDGNCENLRCSCFASKRGCSRYCRCKGCSNPRESSTNLPPDVETVISSWGNTEYQDSDTEVDIVSLT